MLAVVLTSLVAQATPKPTTANICAPTAVKLVKPGRGYSAPQSVPLSVRIAVTVSGKGVVEKAVVTKGSGSTKFDREALYEARTATYKPGTKNCKPVTGVYDFRLALVITT